MSKYSKSLAISAVTLVVILIGASIASIPGYAATPPQGATPIGNGQASGGPTPAPGPVVASLEFSLVELPNGSLNGQARLTSYDGWGGVRFDFVYFQR